MHDWLEKRFNKKPDKVLVKTESRSYTYSDINDTVYDRAQALKDFGLKKGQFVGIYLPNSMDFIESYLGCYKVRAVSVILNKKWRDNEIKKSVQQIPIDYIICQFSDKKKLSRLKIPLIFIEELSKSYGSCFLENLSSEYSNDDVQTVLFTSGTKGFPKAVCLTYDNFYQSSIKWAKAVNLKKADHYLVSLPMYHIGGLAILMRAIHIGFTIVLPSIFENYIEKQNDITIISTVPAQLFELIKNEKILKNLKSLRCIIVSGSKISKDLLNSCVDKKLNIFISYGMTETCSSIAGFWLLKHPSQSDSVGKPFNGVKIKKIKDSILVQSNTVMKKYYGGIEKKNRIITGDAGYFEDGFLYINGRLDGQIISGGENINPNEVTNFLKETLLLKSEISTFTFSDEKWGQSYGIIIKTNKKINAKAIKSHLKKNIADYKIPKKIIVEKL